MIHATMIRWVWHIACLMAFWVGGCVTTWAAVPEGSGVVDVSDYNVERHEVTVLGWMGSAQPQVFVTQLRVFLGEHTIYQGRWQGAPRPDVAQATHRPDWLMSGFRVVARIPWAVPSGTYPVRVVAQLGNGGEFELQHATAEHAITLNHPQPRGMPMWGLLLIVTLPICVILACPWRGSSLRRWCGPGGFFGTVVLAFVMLVATGTTGSSIPLLLKGAEPVVAQAPVWMGQPRSVRSDEWEVITPMAVSQQAHRPSFPVVNQNLGTGGHNMLVVGMTGVPVAHISTVAKPATWGFFVLPLPQALAWYWWFPFFGCFGVMWALLWRVIGIDWRGAAAWSAAFAYSPYSAAFSGWPAYLAFFGVAGLLCGIQLLRAEHRWQATLWGLGLGVALAGYALVLYPAWQISLGYLLVAYALGWVYANRASLYWRAAQWGGCLMAAVVAVVLLGTWWQDAASAVNAIQATIYPGQRSTSVGGDVDIWYPIKGLLSPVSMYQTTALMDASDAGSVVWLLAALMPSLAFYWWQRRHVDAIGLALASYLVFLLCYLYIGLPEPLASASQWGRATTYRMDLALGLAQLLLLASLWRANYEGARWVGALGAALTLGAMAWCYQWLPAIIVDGLSPAFLWMSALLWALTAYLLAAGRWGAATGVVTVWMLATAIPFHPLVRAPEPFALTPDIARWLSADDRVAVIDQRNWSLLLPAAGVAVVNAVHYHPPQALWQQLDPQGQDSAIHNRYQRLLLRLKEQPEGARSFVLETPRLDEVVLTLDPARFRFERLQATRVLAPLAHAPALGRHPGLSEVARGPDWVLMRVMPHANSHAPAVASKSQL